MNAVAVGDFVGSMILYGGGSAAVAYVIFRFLGEKWIESKFSAQLESVKHEHAVELQDLKKKIDAELSRTIKIQDQEFTVLPKAWGLLHEALGQLAVVVSMFRQYPDLSQMPKERLEEWAKGCRLTDVHKAELIAAPDKNKFYQSIIFWYELNDARNAWVHYRDFINRNSIFLRPALRDVFLKINGIMWDALISREVGHEANDYKMWGEASKKVRDEIEPLVKELEARVQAVLHTGAWNEPEPVASVKKAA